MSVSSSSTNPCDQVPRKHQFNLNFQFPSLDNSGMMWFRDDDVEVGDSMCGILTVCQPLWDVRDQDSVSPHLDVDDPTLLSHRTPTVPTFMWKDFEKVHQPEESEENPEMCTETRKKHKKHACKIENNNILKLEINECQLPFAPSLEKFDEIDHEGSAIRKHLRTIPIEVENSQTECRSACVCWKVVIDGETTFCSEKSCDKRNVHKDAEQRMCEAFQEMDVGDDGTNITA